MAYITVNGEKKLVEGNPTVKDLLRDMGIEIREVGLAVAVNGEVIPKSLYDTKILQEGDSVEIVQLVGGG